MTHYMELLASNQPWNLIVFMAVPVILAETLTVSELAILFNRKIASSIRDLNKYCGILLGFYFLAIFIYLLFNAVIPISSSGSWRGIGDIIAVSSYLLGVVPLFGITLIELKILYSNKSAEERLKIHAILLGAFLIIAHVAMIFGMLNPSILGYQEIIHSMDM